MKKMTKAMLITALILGSVSMGAAVEANELNTFALDEYVVTATRYEKKDLDVAASVEVFDQERLEATGASNLYEAMQFAAGIEMQQYGTGGASLGNMSSKVSENFFICCKFFDYFKSCFNFRRHYKILLEIINIKHIAYFFQTLLVF